MVYILALLSAALYGAADFIGGSASRRASMFAVVTLSQGSGLVALLLALGVYALLRVVTLGGDVVPSGAASVAYGYPWWARRMARGGQVLAPGAPGHTRRIARRACRHLPAESDRGLE